MNAMSPKAEVHFGSEGSRSLRYWTKLRKQTKCHSYYSSIITMSTFTNPTSIFIHSHCRLLPKIQATTILASNDDNLNLRRRVFTTVLTVTSTSVALGLGLNSGKRHEAMAENWGTRSLLREKYFGPGLSPEDAVARIRQTSQGLHSLREMLETMSWRYVFSYIRLKQSYLSEDMTNALKLVPQGLRKSYITTANELVDNMTEFDRYVRTPKVYESYLYYEKTLKSIDDLVAFLP